jgi:rhodanese-related sulfurtransferase
MRPRLGKHGIAGLILLAAMGFACEGSHPQASRISIAEAVRLHRNSAAVFVDVRTGRSWETSAVKIAGALRQDPDAVEQWAGLYATEKTLVLYCT